MASIEALLLEINDLQEGDAVNVYREGWDVALLETDALQEMARHYRRMRHLLIFLLQRHSAGTAQMDEITRKQIASAILDNEVARV